MTNPVDRTSTSAEEANLREIRYEYSHNLVNILSQLGASLFVSTYQAGKLAVVSVNGSSINISCHNFERAMGIALGSDRIGVGGDDWIYFLKNAPELAPQIEPKNHYDACFLTRGSHFTNNISVHEIAWGSQELWIVNTLFSCLCTLHNNYSFVPQWKPPFISALAAEDRCHLNGLALVNGSPKYVTVLGQTDTAGGWRENKATGGCVLEVPTGKVIVEGLAMPHSPRFYQNRLWVLNSGVGELMSLDLISGKPETVAILPGYARGLALIGNLAFVGLSKIRETAVFGSLPICERFDDLKCGVAIIDIPTGEMLGLLELHSGVDEIFDVQLLPFIRRPAFFGPYARREGIAPIWLVPTPDNNNSLRQEADPHH